MKRRTIFIYIVTMYVIILCCWKIFIKPKLEYINHNNIVMEHPAPQLKLILPEPIYKALKWVDEWLDLTCGIIWYKVKEKATGKEFIIVHRYNGMIGVYDIETREGHIVTRLEYLKRFEQPIFGVETEQGNRGIFIMGYML